MLMFKTLEIDHELCIGCGFCIESCPEVFQWEADKKALVVNVEGCEHCDCEEIAKNCPVQAIKIE